MSSRFRALDVVLKVEGLGTVMFLVNQFLGHATDHPPKPKVGRLEIEKAAVAPCWASVTTCGFQHTYITESDRMKFRAVKIEAFWLTA